MQWLSSGGEEEEIEEDDLNPQEGRRGAITVHGDEHDEVGSLVVAIDSSSSASRPPQQ